MPLASRIGLWCLALMLLAAAGAQAAQVPRISPSELKARMGQPDLVILDVRSRRDWRASDAKIKGALRQEPFAADKWAAGLDRSKTYVLYCA